MEELDVRACTELADRQVGLGGTGGLFIDN